MNRDDADPPTAFEETAAALGDLVRQSEIDVPALSRKISPCDLGDCHGVCCHDGVYLGPDEAKIIDQLVAKNRSDFEALGLDLPNPVIVFGNWRDLISGLKTATRSEPMSAMVEEYPEHFPDTACVFLMTDGRCGLQQFAADRDLHPWYFKPATCWIHPLSIVQRSDAPPLLTLFDRESDPQNLPDYDGFVSRTHCGRVDDCGTPAFEVLSGELEMLGRLGRRDLLGEIRANPVGSAIQPS